MCIVLHDHTPSEKSEGFGILPVPFSFFPPPECAGIDTEVVKPWDVPPQRKLKEGNAQFACFVAYTWAFNTHMSCQDIFTIKGEGGGGSDLRNVLPSYVHTIAATFPSQENFFVSIPDVESYIKLLMECVQLYLHCKNRSVLRTPRKCFGVRIGTK